MDDAAICGVRDRARVQRAIQAIARRGNHGFVRRIRPAHADGLQLGPPPRPRRGGQGRGRHRLDRGHARLVRRYSARPGDDVDDHQFSGGDFAAALPIGCGGEGNLLIRHRRNDPKRCSEGVHRSRHLYLPAGAESATNYRHLHVLPSRDSEMEHDLHLRLSHGRGGSYSRAGDRLHAGQRDRVRASGRGVRPGRRRFRSSPGLLLRLSHVDHRGSGKVPGRTADVGAHHEGAIRGQGPEVLDAAVPHTNRWSSTHCTAARGEPRAGRGAGPRGGPGWHPIAAHELVRRSHRVADGEGGTAGASHAAGSGVRDRCDQDRRSVRWFVCGRIAHRRDRRGCDGVDRARRRIGRCGGSDRRGLSEV